MTEIQEMLDFIEHLKPLNVSGTLGGLLVEHALFTMVLITILAVWALMTTKDFTKRSK